MAVPPIPIAHLVALNGGAGLTDQPKETSVEHLAHPLANIAFLAAGYISLRAIWRTIKESARG